MTALWVGAVACSFVAGALLAPWLESLGWWLRWSWHGVKGDHARARHRKG